ncbi:MAG TPA: hypothetical protein PLR01_06180 [Bacteroidales bacterium]|nr:hypothetical protein [Bacteroidales bacterium]
MRIFIQKYYRCCLPAYFLIILFLVFGMQTAAAQKKSSKKEKHFEAEIKFGSMYDDNILKYSGKYIDRFINRQDSGRFHIKTYDDIVFITAADLSATYRIFKDLKTRINGSIYSNMYATNGVKNWYYFTLGLTQNVTKKASFRVSYSHIPRFYVRHFRDADRVEIYGYTPETFVPFSFAKDNYGFWFQNTFLKSTRVRLSFDLARYFHNKHYTEYDCNSYIFGISVSQPLHKKVKIEAAYEFEHSDAKGYDEPGETRETADDADATYNEYAFALGLNWELPKIRKKTHEIDLNATYQNRVYFSEHFLEEDPEHTGRVDDVVLVTANYNLQVSKSFTLGAFYKFFMRNSNSSSEINSEYLSEEKDYRQDQVGLQVVYNLKF